jgi:hypothetical protein
MNPAPKLLPRIPWSKSLEEEIVHLRKKLSFGRIAEEIGYPGRRGAIAGKLRRLGDKWDGAKRDQLPWHWKPPRDGTPKRNRKRTVLNRPPKRVIADYEPLMTPYLEVRWSQCRWLMTPVGDPRVMRFCGGETEPGRSWCPFHNRMALSAAGRRAQRQGSPPSYRTR